MTDTMRKAIGAAMKAEACPKCVDMYHGIKTTCGEVPEPVDGYALAMAGGVECLACAERALAAAFRVALAEPPGHDDISRAGLDAMRAVSDGESVGGPGWFVASMVLLALREALGLETT